MSIVQDVAEWIHAREEGALCGEVATAFSITAIKASVLISQIQREPRFTTRVEHGRITDDNGKGRHARRLYVDQVQPPRWHKTPVIGTNDKEQTVRFASITDAERVGGFIRVGITRCLNNSQATHGGYRRAVASSEQNG
ncbi:hypothetical protein J9893_10025 [Aeromonas sp. MaB10011B]|uniref:hypothetical protein n=1 Tax=unclassified Aeromonas TaxID=257493 RepID=UPI001B33FF9C|nr:MULTISPECIES: hypothetical protein [unclassified Aeromonas]MBP4067324.1 hypothetical protein [Aeromonas sp. MaB10011B]MBP4082492.1 hypothetical protein [Aeromonas sp. MrichA-1]